MDLDEVGRDSGVQARIIRNQVGMGESEAEGRMGGGTPKKSKGMKMPLTPEPEPAHRQSRKKVQHHPKAASREDHDHHRSTKRARNSHPILPSAKKTVHPYPPSNPSGSCLPQHDQFATTSHTSIRSRTELPAQPITQSPIAAIPTLPDHPMQDSAPDSTVAPLSTIINHHPSSQHHSQPQSIPHFDPALASEDDSETTHVEHRQKRRRIQEWLGEESVESTSGRGLEENIRSSSPQSASHDLKESPRRHRTERSPAKPKVKHTPLPSTPLPSSELFSTPPPSLLSDALFTTNATSSQRRSVLAGSSRAFRPTSESASATRGSSGRRVRTEADERDISIIKLLRVKSVRAGSSSRALPLPMSQATTE